MKDSTAIIISAITGFFGLLSTTVPILLNFFLTPKVADLPEREVQSLRSLDSVPDQRIITEPTFLDNVLVFLQNNVFIVIGVVLIILSIAFVIVIRKINAR